MAKPYSMDLRERAIARLDAGESVRTVAEALSVAPSARHGAIPGRSPRALEVQLG